MKHHLSSLFYLLLVVVLLAGCAHAPLKDRQDLAMDIAAQAGLGSFVLNAGAFRVAGFRRPGDTGAPTVVYIEGDGFAWINYRTISPNPTPRNPLALRLAAADPAPGVVYLSRPCQYMGFSRESNCHRKYWTSHRFAEEVIAGYDLALDEMARRWGAMGFHLVGFSGGGAVAALLAARRPDILSLRTVAGNLDHVALNRAIRVSPLTGSLNAMSVAAGLRRLPQIHYSGGKDPVIPAWVAESFVEAMGANACAEARLIPDAEHVAGWPSAWRRLVRDIPACWAVEDRGIRSSPN